MHFKRMAKASLLSSHKLMDNRTSSRKQNMIETSVVCSKRQRLSRLQNSSFSGGAEKCFLSKDASYNPTRSNPTCDNGLYGLKIDSTETYVDDLSLDALLDGSYNLPIPLKSRGKQTNDGSSTITRMVNRAFSVLSNSDKLLAEKNDEPDSDSHKVLEARRPLDDYPSYCLNEVLERLVLPSSKDVDSILFELGSPQREIISSYGTSVNCRREDFRKLCIPPFPWSSSQVGSGRSANDTAKLLNMDNCWQRWVKQKSNTYSHSYDNCASFQALDFLSSLSLKEENNDCHGYDRASPSMTIGNETHQANIPRNIIIGSKFFTPIENDDVHLPLYKGRTVRKIPLTLGNNLREVESSFVLDQSKQTMKHPRNGCYFSLTKCTGENSNQNKCQPFLQVESLDVSMRVAAEILCELRGCRSNSETRDCIF